MIEVKIIADSVAPSGVRLTTFVLTYPRFIHSEFMTHRVFSRNASSSRAIPVKKQIEMVMTECAIPLAFTRNQKGMQGGEPLVGDAHDKAVEIWLRARDAAAGFAKELSDLEVHKQYANRLLEPFAFITVICTSCEWNNFFALRIHGDAQPEIHALAAKMYDAYYSGNPDKLQSGQWHMPFITEMDGIENPFEPMDFFIKKSVARCARVSYLTHDGKPTTTEQDLQLYDRLLSGNPIHASPAEHQAMAIGDPSARSGNFRGWVQYRKTLSNENLQRSKI